MAVVFLSLGSNIPPKKNYLESALERLSGEAGKVEAISPLYWSEAWGFEGAPFLNLVVKLHTDLPPEALLDLLLRIEAEAGRVRKGKGYQNRPLDIDILTYGGRVIRTPRLTVPHPLLHKRRFVLQPWNDIAPGFRVPGFDKTVSELLSLCPDPTPVVSMKDSSGLPPFPFDFIAIEGNIGAGKTTLATLLADEYGAKLITERFEENPFLPKFYEDPKRYAFPLEMSFLADRYQQLLDELVPPDLFSPFTVSDYYVIKSLIFAGVTLEDEEYRLYRKIFNFMYRELKKPDLYIYLYRPVDDLLRNIAKRGREYEKNITPEYLRQIHEGYMNFIRSTEGLNVLILDITGVDFVSNPGYYQTIKDIIAHTPKTPEVRRIKIEADD